MKKLFAIVALVALFATASAQKSIVKVACNADKTIKLWNNKKAPHSNEEIKDEWRTKEGHFKNTSQTVFYLYKADASKVPLKRILELYKLTDIKLMTEKQYRNCIDNWEKIKGME